MREYKNPTSAYIGIKVNKDPAAARYALKLIVDSCRKGKPIPPVLGHWLAKAINKTLEASKKNQGDKLASSLLLNSTSSGINSDIEVGEYVVARETYHKGIGAKDPVSQARLDAMEMFDESDSSIAKKTKRYKKVIEDILRIEMAIAESVEPEPVKCPGADKCLVPDNPLIENKYRCPVAVGEYCPFIK